MTPLLALAVVLLAAACGGRLATLLGLPAVTGQMLVPILLGPLAAGAAWPGVLHRLFPPDARSVIGVLGSVAAGTFLFLVGASRHPAPGASRRNVALLIVGNVAAAGAVTSVAVPVAVLVTGHRLSTRSTLFLVVAFTVCALPVLAQLISATGLTGTRAANAAIAFAAATDLAAWTTLALLGSSAGGGWQGTLLDLAGKAAAVAAGWLLLRRAVHLLLRRHPGDRAVTLAALGCAASGVAAAHAVHLDLVLGAFAGGLLLAAARAGTACATTEPAALRTLGRANAQVLLPVFFAAAGLTEAPLVAPARLLALTAVFSLLALAGRVAGTMPLARWTGLQARELRTFCCLICARGATELVILRIGLGLGLVSGLLYASMVLTALLTTLLSAVALSAVSIRRPVRLDWPGRLVGWWLELMASTATPWYDGKAVAIPARSR